MTKKTARMDSNLLDVVQLISEDEVSAEMGEAFASFMLNPTVVWAKFVLTDDRKNANSQRVPQEEFVNLIKSGIHMPVKMALGEIKPGHDDSKPLGVITHLKEVETQDGVKALVALAALWGEERPSDVEYIRERFKKQLPVDVSWEILYGDSKYNTEEGSEDLYGTVLKAATVVGMPAYQGRTSFLSVAAKKWSKAYIDKLTDESFLYVDREGERMFPYIDADGMVDKAKVYESMAALGESNLPMQVIKDKKLILSNLIEKFESGASILDVSTSKLDGESGKNLEEYKVNPEELKAKVETLEAERDEALASKVAAEEALATKVAEFEALSQEKKELETELAPLQEFKASVDAEKELVEKLDKVKEMFVEAGLEKDEEYFETNSEKLLGLEESAIEFMIQELKAFAESTEATASTKTKRIPALGGDSEAVSPKDLAAELRSKHAKKN